MPVRWRCKLFGQSTATIEPCQGALDHPAHRQHLEPFGLIRSFHDFHRQLRQALRHGDGKPRSLVASISKQFEQERMQPEQGRQQEHATIAVLNIGRMHDGVQQQA